MKNSIIGFASIGIIVAIIGVFSVRIVSEGYRGVVLVLGQAQENTLEPGIHLVAPGITQVISIDVREQKVQVDADSASKDLQSVASTIALNYQVSANEVRNLYSEIGIDYDNVIIQPAIQEAVKSATAQFTASELITKRIQVREEIREILADRLEERFVTVTGFSIVNFSFSEEFDKSIELTQVAQQEVLRSEQELKRIEVEAKQQIARAEAEAESLRLQAESVNKDLIELRKIEAQRKAIEKWNGELPTYTGDGVPFIQIK